MTLALPSPAKPTVYPSSDGKPMADNTKQARWIVVLYGNLSALFADDPAVFVAADNLWYPVEGEPDVVAAPDVYVVFGRPKGDRPSYKQWQEGNVPVTVAIEVRSPANDHHEMMAKQLFYEDHGVEEYYEYDPDANRLYAFVRRGDVLVRVRDLRRFVSPRLGVRFELTESDLHVYGPDGERFLTFEELQAERRKERQRADLAERRANDSEKRANRLAELGRKARHGQATAEELAELERLEQPPA
jgi:Uma2 family endonuclease